MVRIVHYLNQFFGQIGGEDQAGIPPKVVTGPVGPGVLIERLAAGRAKVVATLICGDNYFAEKSEEALRELLSALRLHNPDLLVAGPAFNAGRYGLACGALCAAAGRETGLVTVTGMYPENPGAELYKKSVYILETGNNGAGMKHAMPKLLDLGFKLVEGQPVGKPVDEGYIPQGVKTHVIADKRASERAIDLLLKKMKGEEYGTEIPLPILDAPPPAKPVADLRQATIALVTEGGMIPLDNPDRIESIRATRYGKYSIEELVRFGSQKFQSIHRGFDSTNVNEDPMRLLPADVLLEMREEGIFGALLPFYFVTTGLAMPMANGEKIGAAIAAELKSLHVSGVILTGT
jgi:glycine reductase complex component B subunit gamma